MPPAVVRGMMPARSGSAIGSCAPLPPSAGAAAIGSGDSSILSSTPAQHVPFLCYENANGAGRGCRSQGTLDIFRHPCRWSQWTCAHARNARASARQNRGNPPWIAERRSKPSPAPGLSMAWAAGVLGHGVREHRWQTRDDGALTLPLELWSGMTSNRMYNTAIRAYAQPLATLITISLVGGPSPH
jgi:hypothetical protein